MKIYVVECIPDYIGVDIEFIYAKEEDAIKKCEELNAEQVKSFGDWVKNTYFYEEYDVLGVNL